MSLLVILPAAIWTLRSATFDHTSASLLILFKLLSLLPSVFIARSALIALASADFTAVFHECGAQPLFRSARVFKRSQGARGSNRCLPQYCFALCDCHSTGSVASAAPGAQGRVAVRSPPVPLCFVVFLPPIASMQMFNDSLCAGHVSSCCLGCHNQRSAALRYPHNRTQAFELEGQLQVGVAAALHRLSFLWPPRLATQRYKTRFSGARVYGSLLCS